METKLSLLDESSVIQRPNEKLEVPRLQRTDTGLQALLPEINTAKRDQSVCLGRREGKTGSGQVAEEEAENDM